MVPHSAKYWDSLSFPDFKARLRCSQLRGNRMRWGGRKCIVGQRWDYGVRREDQVEIQKMCWPQVELSMCVWLWEHCSLRHFSWSHAQGSQFKWRCSFKALPGKKKMVENHLWVRCQKIHMRKMHDARRLKGLINIVFRENAIDSCW